MTSHANVSVSSRDENLRQHVGRMGEIGRKQIKQMLTDSKRNPWETIKDIQSTWSINLPRTDAALCLLDSLGCTRSMVFIHIVEELKKKFDSQINQMDETQLLAVLKDTIKLVVVEELKSIPTQILKKLTIVPVVYLDLLVKQNLLEVYCNIDLRD